MVSLLRILVLGGRGGKGPMVRSIVHNRAAVTHLDVDLVLLVWIHDGRVEQLGVAGYRGVEDEEGQGRKRGQRVWYDDRLGWILMMGL